MEGEEKVGVVGYLGKEFKVAEVVSGLEYDRTMSSIALKSCIRGRTFGGSCGVGIAFVPDIQHGSTTGD